MDMQYVTDSVFPGDESSERARRVELYAKQVEASQAVDKDKRYRQGPFARPVFCEQLKDRFPNGFPTLKAAAEFIGTKRSHLRRAIRKGRRCKGCLFVDRDGGKRVRIRTGRERPVRCLNNGVALASITEAAKYAGISASGLCMALREANGNPASGGGRLWQYLREQQQLYLFDAAPRKLPRTRCAKRPRVAPRVIQLILFDEAMGVGVIGVEHGESGNLVRGQRALAA